MMLFAEISGDMNSGHINEIKAKENGSSIKNVEDDVINELLSKVHRQVN